jgi:hypothetical protein
VNTFLSSKGSPTYPAQGSDPRHRGREASADGIWDYYAEEASVEVANRIISKLVDDIE